MPKSPKSHTTRKPPEPSGSHAGIQAWIERSMPGMQPLLKAVDKQVRDAIPGLQYGIKWGKA